jgi:hypothetical protein
MQFRIIWLSVNDELERVWSWPKVMCYHSICLRQLKKLKRKVRNDSWRRNLRNANHDQWSQCWLVLLFFYSHSGGVELGPLGTSATEWPIVPATGDCDDGEFGGMKIGRGNRSTRRKPALEPLFPPQIPLAKPVLEPGPPRWEASD